MCNTLIKGLFQQTTNIDNVWGGEFKKVAVNLELMKRLNRSLILETIRNEQPISRAGIAKKLNLSRSTVSSLVDELLYKKLVVEVGLGKSTHEGGRRGMELGFNPRSAFGVGVDIGGTKILIVITDLNGGVVYREKVKTTGDVDAITELVKRSLTSAGVSQNEVVAMGVGVPGITDVKKGLVIDAPGLKWTNIRLRDKLQSEFRFPVFINNDVNCAALGERWLGSGKNSNHIFFIGIGTGVGSSIISDGNLIHGFNFQSGEIAYNITEEDVILGDFSKFGDFGTMEKKICGQSLARKGFTSQELFQEYTNCNREVFPIMDYFILQLSILIANCVNLLNPEYVIIGGGVSESMDVILEKIQESVGRFTPIKTTIKLASLGGDAGGLGAIAYSFNEVNESSIFDLKTLVQTNH
jgi:glucokinase